MNDMRSDMRPSDLALFLLASGENQPRKRARDQQADIAGLELKRQVLDLLITADPEPAELEAALMQIVGQLGAPTGPTRAICGTIREEWETAALVPGFVEWLIEQALRESASPGARTGKRRREPAAEHQAATSFGADRERQREQL
jgi:hypothetical protein